MNIEKWTEEQIMQLPDYMFGQRWALLTCRRIPGATTHQWLMKKALPNRCIVWSINVHGYTLAGYTNWFKLALAEKEPKSDAEFDTLERIFKGDLENVEEEGGIFFSVGEGFTWHTKQILKPQGKKIAIQAANAHATSAIKFALTFVISSIPKEIPEWMFSGRV